MGESGWGRGALGAEGSLQVTGSKKLDPHTYRCKGMNSANNLRELRSEFFPSQASQRDHSPPNILTAAL